MEEKFKEFKESCKETKEKVKTWLHENGGTLVTIFGGICTVAGATINYCTKKYEEDSYVYVKTKKDGYQYRIKAKRLPTVDDWYSDETEEE